MIRFFINIHNVLKSKKLLAIVAFLCVVTALGFLASKIGFEEDITKLIPSSEKSEITNKVLNQINFADKIIVYTEASKNATANDLTEYAEAFITELQKEDIAPFVKEIQGKVEENQIDVTLNFIYENLPLFLNEQDYQQITTKLNASSLDSIVQNNYKTLISPTGFIAKKNIVRDPLGLTFMGLKKLQALQGDENFELNNGFLVTKDHKNLLLFIKPNQASNETDKNTLFVEKLYTIQNNLNTKFKDKVHSEFFGSTVIAVANASQIKHDIQFTVSIAMSILLLILIFFYRKIYIPLVLFTPTLLGGLTAVAFLFLLKGKISAISLGIGSVLLGITLDYSLHVLTHFKENNNVTELYKDVVKPTLMSSITTAIAFLCLIFLKSEALQDLGIFASVAVVSASIFALIIIPLVYKPSSKQAKSSNFIEKIAKVSYHKNKVLIFSLLTLCAVSFFFSKKVFFDNDISKMNYQTEALKNTEKKLDKLTSTNSKSLYSVSYGNSINDALHSNNLVSKKLEELKADNKIISFNSIGSLVLSSKEQEKRINTWKNFWTNTKKESLQQNLIASGNKIGFKPSVHQPFYNILNNNFETKSIDEYQKLKTLFVDEFISSKNDLTTTLSLVKVSDKNYKEVTDILKTFNNQVVIDRQQMNETFLGNLKTDFNQLLKYSFIALFIILIIFFRNLELTFITILPIIITWFITVGIMGMLNVHFNIFNIIISTFIFGLGVDYSIFITNGLIKQYKYKTEELKTYKTSILLSVITTILGVGVLVFAKHPALKSISIVSIIGIVSAMLIAYTIQPLLFNLLAKNRAKNGVAPIKFRKFIHSIFLNLFYALGGMILSVFSITILPLLPISKKIKMKWMHKVMAKLVTATLYGNPFVKKEVRNPHNETFTKPAIIISNHASTLDTLTIGLLTHNVIYLVNDWVYKSPVFGLLARVLGFYPVSNGVDGSVDHLKEKLNQGYCMVVFPEGKRSFTNKVGRFKKGAFFLAQKLEIDILPIYLHGNSEIAPKKDFVIHDGSLTVVVGKRIPFNELEKYGENDRKITKNISAIYKEELLEIRKGIEQENYFKDILLSNYHYKGFDLIKTIKQDFEQHKTTYHSLSEHLPMKANIAHIADNYGQIDILLVSKSLDRKITTFVKDNTKRTIAQNCYVSNNKDVKYTSCLENLFSSKAEILIISTEISEKELESINYTDINKVILINNVNLVNHFSKLKFNQHTTVNTITILNKSE